MKFTLATVASILAVVAAQDISSLVSTIPSCADTCLTTAISSANCGITDYACQCGSGKQAITESASPCVIKACSSSDALSMLPTAF